MMVLISPASIHSFPRSATAPGPGQRTAISISSPIAARSSTRKGGNTRRDAPCHTRRRAGSPRCNKPRAEAFLLYMNTHRHAARLLALLVATAFTICRADDKAKPPPVKPPTEAELRAVITKGLGFLAKAGDEWMAAKSCNGCHHLPELLWSHREAKPRGFAFDQKQFDEWLEWSVENASKKPGPQEAAFLILAMPDRSVPELTKLLPAEKSGTHPAAKAPMPRVLLFASVSIHSRIRSRHRPRSQPRARRPASCSQERTSRPRWSHSSSAHSTPGASARPRRWMRCARRS